ncbi:MAG: hypothetical protein Q7R41_01630 [Phycisphaerales bacterium]|nr:hypothetical protein [Phycisphaerales bacterium]
MTRWKGCPLAGFAVAFLLCDHIPAQAQGFAVRGGANVNPDQFYGGGQYELGPLTDRVWLQPKADLGWGNGAMLTAVNFDVTYRKPLQRNGPWTGYVGGGPAINWYRLDAYSTTDLGVSTIAGLMHANGMFTEFMVGFFDSPQFRVGIGYAFRPGRPRTPPRRR